MTLARRSPLDIVMVQTNPCAQTANWMWHSVLAVRIPIPTHLRHLHANLILKEQLITLLDPVVRLNLVTGTHVTGTG